VVEHGGTLGRGDLAAYEAIERRPIAVPFRGAEVLTNPPPSSGGILIAYCLGLLERLGPGSGPDSLSPRWMRPHRRRDPRVRRGALREGMEVGFLDPAGLDLAARDLSARRPTSRCSTIAGTCARRHLLNGSRLGGAGARGPG